MQRQSNIELLRLLSIFSLLFLHLCNYSLPSSVTYAQQSGFWEHLPKLICTITTIQVNVFVLISGWFGIHTTLKKILNFYLVCAFYGVLTLGLSLFVLGTPFSVRNILLSFLPFSFMPGWWFVKAYLFLMLLAPLFNKAIDHMSKNEFVWILCALTIINVYCGFFARQAINPSGTNFMQLMYMYFIGRYLALHVKIDSNKLRKWSLIGTIVGVTLYACIWILNDSILHIVKSVTFLNNNNPLALFNSIAIFLFFTTLQFKSKAVNWLAKGVFPVYLIHQSIWLCQDWNTSLASIYDYFQPGIAWLIVTTIFVFYFFFVLCFDHIRMWITDPIINKFEQYANSNHLYI